MATVRLTDAYLRRLKCEVGARAKEVRDAEVGGLEIRVMASGAKSWRLHYTRRSDGRRRVVGMGSYPARSLKAARAEAKRLQASVEDDATRADPAAEKRARRVAVTFADLADEWMERHARPHKSPRTVQDDVAMLKRHVLPQIGDMKATEVTKRDVIRLLDKVAARPDARMKPAGKGKRSEAIPRKLTHRPNRVYELVRSIFRWALGRDLIKSNPTFGIEPPIKKERARERALSPTEIRQLWDALDRAPAVRTKLRRQPDDFPMRKATALTLKLALATAQRIGEVAGIAISELDLNDTAPVWTIPGERAKNGEPSRVPLSPLALGLIAEARALSLESQWLFPSPTNGEAIAAHAATKALERARPWIGLEDFRIHDLRRTAATRMAEMGISPHTISLVLNHVSARKGTITGRVYVQYTYDREKREALNAWGDRLAQFLDPNVVALRRDLATAGADSPLDLRMLDV